MWLSTTALYTSDSFYVFLIVLDGWVLQNKTAAKKQNFLSFRLFQKERKTLKSTYEK